MLPRIITTLAGWAVAIFYRLERTGPDTPGGPLLIAANHPNALADPLVIFRTAGRRTRPLAKAPLFEQMMVGTMLRALGGLPVFRRQDDPELLHLNERTFDAAIEALRAGGAVQIYPEGQSHSEPSLTPLRTGCARIALLAEDRAGWSLGLRIQPVGLTYERKPLFRGRATVAYGEPIRVADFRETYESDERRAVRVLTDVVRARLEGLTLNFEQEEDRELVEVAERLYASAKRLTGPRERPSLGARMPRLRAFADGLRWLRETDPERLSLLRRSVRRYLRLLTLFGAREGDVPARYRPPAVAAWVVRQVATLTLVLPAALLGIAAWAAPFFFTRAAAPLFRPLPDQVATYKLGVAFVAFPLWYAALLVAVFFRGGATAAGWAAGVLPLCGLAAVAWRDRQHAVREDVRVFLRAVRRSEARDRLREQRDRLVAEFDALEAAWRAQRVQPEP